MVITCRKCGEPFYVQSADIRGNQLRVYAQCLKGHKGRREFGRMQAEAVALELFEGIFTCIDCGSIMSLANTDVQRDMVEYVFVCPIHGPVRKQIPSYYVTAIGHLKGKVNSAKSVLDSLSCPRCKEVFVVHEIEDKQGILYMKSRCPNNHKEMRYLARDSDESILKAILKRLVHCDTCGLPCTIVSSETKKDRTRVELSCPVHGQSKKEIPAGYAHLLDAVVDAVSDAGLVRSMLRCRDCGKPLSIRSIESEKDKLKFKSSCVNGHSFELVHSVQWGEESAEEIARGLLKCKECDLLAEVISKKVEGSHAEIEILCPIHGASKKGMTVEAYKQFETSYPNVSRQETLDESMKCRKCSAPAIVKDVKPRKDDVEVKIECHNGHSDDRYIPIDYSTDALLQLYSRAYECTKCHDPLKLLEIEAKNGFAQAKVVCEKHGESKFEIPTSHMTPLKDAFVATVTMAKLEPIVEGLESRDSSKFQIDPGLDSLEILQVVKSVIEQHDLQLVSELSPSDLEHRVWYYGRAMMGDEYVIMGSVSMSERELLVEGYSDNKERITSLVSQMNDTLRDILLRIHTDVADLAPTVMKCVNCDAALEKRGLPGETTRCTHCGTPLHWR